MTFAEYRMRPPEDQALLAVDLQWDEAICRRIQETFKEAYASPKIGNISAGAYGIGGGPVIQVTLGRGAEKVKLPKTFMGFTVIRKYERGK